MDYGRRPDWAWVGYAAFKAGVQVLLDGCIGPMRLPHSTEKNFDKVQCTCSHCLHACGLRFIECSLNSGQHQFLTRKKCAGYLAIKHVGTFTKYSILTSYLFSQNHSLDGGTRPCSYNMILLH